MSLQTIYIIIGIISTIVGTTVPAIIALVKAIKKYKAAKTEAEKQAAINEMATAAKSFIANAEELYKDVDRVLKTQGKSAGSLKKKDVMSELQTLANSKGYEFDSEFWSEQVDKIVNLTRQVNATKTDVQ